MRPRGCIAREKDQVDPLHLAYGKPGAFERALVGLRRGRNIGQHLAHQVGVGRATMTRSCARRSLAAETIFMALVICSVFFTERMRRRRSIRLGIDYAVAPAALRFGNRAFTSLMAAIRSALIASSITFFSRMPARIPAWSSRGSYRARLRRGGNLPLPDRRASRWCRRR